MARAERLIRLVQILRRHRFPVTAETLAEELDVSVRTVYRDVAGLQATGAAVRGEAGIGYILGEDHDLPPLMFTAEELEAIMLGIRMVREQGDAALVRAADDAAGKISAVVGAALRPAFHAETLLAPPSDGQTGDRADMAALRAAIRSGRKVQFGYEDAKGEATSRTVWPLAIGYMGSVRLLIAWCELRQDLRNFRTDRMADFEAKAERYPAKRTALLAEWRARQKEAPQAAAAVTI